MDQYFRPEFAYFLDDDTILFTPLLRRNDSPPARISTSASSTTEATLRFHHVALPANPMHLQISNERRHRGG